MIKTYIEAMSRERRIILTVQINMSFICAGQPEKKHSSLSIPPEKSGIIQAKAGNLRQAYSEFISV